MKREMKKIRIIKDVKEGKKIEIKKGEIKVWEKDLCEESIKKGYAEYVKEDTPKKKKLISKKKSKASKPIKKEPVKPVKKEIIEDLREKVPEKLKGFNFVLIGGDGKQPIEKGWQKKIHKFEDPIIQNHLKQGKNYGLQPNNFSIISKKDSVPRFLVIIDFDTKEFQDKVIKRFPKTFTTTSGSPKKCVHLWFASDNNKAFKIKDENYNTLADLIGAGNQVIAPGSKHSSGSIYSVVEDLPFAFMPYSEIKAILKPYDKSPKKIKKPKKEYSPKNVGGDLTEKILNSISMEDVMDKLGMDTSKNPGECFLHSSSGGKCFSYNEETAHCFHCDGSWNKFSLVREVKNLTDKDTFEWFAEEAGMINELKEARKKYVGERKKADVDLFTRRGQIEKFWKTNPFFYDKSKMFWEWDKEEFKWIMSDEVNFCNSIYERLNIPTIDSKSRSELVEGFKQVGRKHQPEDAKKSWIQFKENIYDIKTGENFKATPEYFITNPIPWDVGKSKETPNIDRLFDEWVGEKYRDNLYEFIAYSLSLDQFMQRLFTFCGGGANGKGTFIKLCYKFIGEDNCVSSEIKSLSEDRFEPAVLYRKLLCVMGEVSHDDLQNTNQLKKLGGEDKLSIQFKGKTPRTEDNTATCVCLTNSLPITPDKSIGFYRKWLIIDFPNQFKDIKKDIIEEIPEIEFNNLALKCLDILKNLYETRAFTREGDFKEREKRYEERSNPVMRFVEEHCEEGAGDLTTLRDFSNKCNEYMKEKHLRVLTPNQINKILSNEGFIIGPRKIEGMSARCIVNLRFLEEKIEIIKVGGLKDGV